MTKHLIESVPYGFDYDHPFIVHMKSDYEITYDAKDGWLVLRDDKIVAYFTRANDAIGFVKRITFQSTCYFADDSRWEC